MLNSCISFLILAMLHNPSISAGTRDRGVWHFCGSRPGRSGRSEGMKLGSDRYMEVAYESLKVDAEAS